ncbi:class II histone deacetylase [Agrobacterium pusense]|uniref:class II histone deacetylase n=1 Tax=Agrobacterium pusense TaxID=648995 RepID=UPI001572056E|nr:class II histone deacetylase [Agrobacterium pusense]NTE48089.1 class II histone deacetylase [Agrobacterium pusense]
MSTAFFTHESTFWHFTGVQSLFFPVGGWVEPPSGTYGADTPESKRRILNLIAASGLADKLSFPQSEPASRAQLLTVHTASYLDEFKRVSDAGGGDLGSLAPFSSGGYEIATRSAGLAIAAIESVLDGTFKNAFALCRPSGHHCTADTPMAFCLLANTAVAVETARLQRRGLRVAIIDWDVHFANGTQELFYEDGNVLTISIHQEGCRPPGQQGGEIDERGRGEGYGANLNIPLPPGSGHDAYLYAFSKLVVPKVEAFAPDLIVVSSGLDANAVDPLSRMLLHSDSFRSLTALTKQLAEKLCDGKLVVVHEGGYAEAYVPFCGLAIVEALSGHQSAAVDPALAIFKTWQPSHRFNRFVQSIIDEYALAIPLP